MPPGGGSVNSSGGSFRWTFVDVAQAFLGALVLIQRSVAPGYGSQDAGHGSHLLGLYQGRA